MANNNTAAEREEAGGMSIKTLWTACKAQWKWFVLSVFVFVCLGMLYVLKQQPVYQRTMSVLIKDTGSSSAFDISNVFSSMGFGGSNSNVNNEVYCMKSPAVMFEVVRRLNLCIDVQKQGLFHPTDWYGKNSPINVYYPDLKPYTYAQMKMVLHPDNSFELSEFKWAQPGASKLSKDNESVVKGSVGFSKVKTPAGVFDIQPNGTYDGKPLDKDAEIMIYVNSEQSAVESYMSDLNADVTDIDADVIDLTISNVSIQKAEDILDMVIQVYNEFWKEDQNAVAVASSKFINERLVDLESDLGSVENKIADFQSENLIVDPQFNAQMYLSNSSAVTKEMLDVSNNLAVAKYILDFINNPQNEEQVIPVLGSQGNSSLDKQISDYNAILLNRNNLAANSSMDNPLISGYTVQLNGLRKSIINGLKSQVGSLQASLKQLDNAQNATNSEMAAAPKQAKVLGSVKREQAVKEALFIFLLQKREENDLSKAFNVSNTRIITPPFGSMIPIKPKKIMTLAEGVIFGLIFPTLVMYFVLMFDTKVRSRHDLENTPIPVIGEIPQIDPKHRIRALFKTKKQKQAEIDRPKPIVQAGKRDIPNESFRVVRSNIDLMMDKGLKCPVLTVTSFNPGSGKSFICFNLGASFALKRNRVLIIDGDLRHGSLSNYVGHPTKGIAAYLTGHVDDPAKICYPVAEFDDFDVIPVGKRPPNPAELLENGRLGQLLEWAKERYDVVLIDCPPVNVVVDTQIINPYGNATIFVVRAGLLEKTALHDLHELYKEGKLSRMSILLNGTTAQHSSYYTYGNYQSYEN